MTNVNLRPASGRHQREQNWKQHLDRAVFDSSSSSDGNREVATDDSLASDAAKAMAAAWQAGQRLDVEEVLKAHPQLAATPRTALRLISEELYLRRESGEPAELEE